MLKTKTKNPFILCILDGWGLYKNYNGNAIAQAKTPNFTKFWKNYSHTELQASGKHVGLSSKQDGNSESGHLNLGAGRIVEQDTVIVSKAIKNGTFFKNPGFLSTVKHVKKTQGNIHLIGLLTGWESAHADQRHIVALLKYYRQKEIKKIYLHLFTDGRDSFKFGALNFLKELKKNMKEGEEIATISGRYYAMDRKKKWDRTERVYNTMVSGKSEFYARSAEEAIQQAYDRGETDEFIMPTVIVAHGKCNEKGVCIGGETVAKIDSNDAVIFFNLRSDRTRQLTKTFVQPDFNKKNPGAFKRIKTLENLIFVAMTDFGPDLDSILSAFPSHDVETTLPMVLTDLNQLYISETEKYAHVTYFFNGGYADPVGGEQRLMIDSPDVASYDLKPEMAAYKITDEILKQLKSKQQDFITVNYPNPDMIGHTGNLAAGIKACETVDNCLGKIYDEIKKQKGVLIITSDHGNAEKMINEKTGEIDTQHSNFPVPFIIIDKREQENKKYNLKTNGILGSVAPTILDLMKINQPEEMTEKSLIV
ncbi:2,3-bisphosphoglycerate-independent phosphoglycerate mutase [Patescibacteria group bacterium]